MRKVVASRQWGDPSFPRKRESSRGDRPVARTLSFRAGARNLLNQGVINHAPTEGRFLPSLEMTV
ncbi:MAG: hypothetical protein ABII25_07340 [bacterium]